MSDTKTAEVICAGVSHFSVEPLVNARGDVRKDGAGNEQYIEVRHEARMGDVIELTPYEYERLEKLGAVQEPGAKPLPGSSGQRPVPTPFGTPLPNEDGDLAYYEGPVMGDPKPFGPGTPDKDLNAGPRALTPQEAAELEARARGAQDPEETGQDELYDSYMELEKEELKAEADTQGLEVTRADGKEGEPLKQDYARALADAERGS